MCVWPHSDIRMIHQCMYKLFVLKCMCMNVCVFVCLCVCVCLRMCDKSNNLNSLDVLSTYVRLFSIVTV